MVFLSNAQREYTLRIGFISLAWGFLSPMLGRISFCIFLLFVAGIDPAIKKWTIYVFMVLQLLVNLGSVIAMYSQCGSHLNVMFEMKNWTEYSQYCWKASVQSDYGYFAGCKFGMTAIGSLLTPLIFLSLSSLQHYNGPLLDGTARCLDLTYPDASETENLPRLSTMSKFFVSDLYFHLCQSPVLTSQNRAMVASIVKTYESKALSQILDYTCELGHLPIRTCRTLLTTLIYQK